MIEQTAQPCTRGKPEGGYLVTIPPNKGVFISYRRATSGFMARAIYSDLTQKGYDVFLDVESINAGKFEEIILSQIAARTHFIVLLSQKGVIRCQQPGDWLRREIERAMQLQRNIIPLMDNDFDFNEAAPYLTGDLARLQDYNARRIRLDTFSETIEILDGRFLKPPTPPVRIYPLTPDQERRSQVLIDSAKQAVERTKPPTRIKLGADRIKLTGKPQPPPARAGAGRTNTLTAPQPPAANAASEVVAVDNYLEPMMIVTRGWTLANLLLFAGFAFVLIALVSVNATVAFFVMILFTVLPGWQAGRSTYHALRQVYQTLATTDRHMLTGGFVLGFGVTNLTLFSSGVLGTPHLWFVLTALIWGGTIIYTLHQATPPIRIRTWITLAVWGISAFPISIIQFGTMGSLTNMSASLTNVATAEMLTLLFLLVLVYVGGGTLTVVIGMYAMLRTARKAEAHQEAAPRQPLR